MGPVSLVVLFIGQIHHRLQKLTSYNTNSWMQVISILDRKYLLTGLVVWSFMSSELDL